MRRALLAIAAFGFTTVSTAHHVPLEELARIDAACARAPHRVDLVLERARLNRACERWGHAAADYLRVMALDSREGDACRPALVSVLVRAGAPAPAIMIAGAAGLEPTADQAEAYERLGRPDLAVAVYDDVLARSGRPTPELHLARARCLLAARPDAVADAIAGLDAGAERLGQPVTLALAALEIECAAQRWDEAIERIARLEQTTKTARERWLVRRGDVLVTAGRFGAASDAYAAAVAAIDARPRSTRAQRALRDAVVAAIARCRTWAETCPEPHEQERVLLR